MFFDTNCSSFSGMSTTQMISNDPLPLLKPHNLKSKFQEEEKTQIRKGYILLISTWVIFLISIGSIFGFWSIPEPENSDFPISNYYTHAILLIPVAAWIWCVISWTGLKLFKHAKGGAIQT